MGYVFKANIFCEKLLDVATNYDTLYVMGCFGSPMTDNNKRRYTNNHNYNKRADRTSMIKSAKPNTFGFDCSGLIKGILWGWCGNASLNYGGAIYSFNDVPDFSTRTILNFCDDVTDDFSFIENGEIVWMEGHVGVYIGNDQVIESSPAWKNGVQITKLYQRKWLKHAKLPWVDYSVEYEINSMISVGDKIKTCRDLKAYFNATDAISKVATSLIYKKGEYFVYKIWFDKAGNLAYNLSRKKNAPGAWVVI